MLLLSLMCGCTACWRLTFSFSNPKYIPLVLLYGSQTLVTAHTSDHPGLTFQFYNYSSISFTIQTSIWAPCFLASTQTITLRANMQNLFTCQQRNKKVKRGGRCPERWIQNLLNTLIGSLNSRMSFVIPIPFLMEETLYSLVEVITVCLFEKLAISGPRYLTVPLNGHSVRWKANLTQWKHEWG